jgi:hypothetical protein
MKTITVKTQEEFDELPNNFEEYTTIYIDSTASIWITVNRRWENAHVVSRENAHVVALENAHVVARGNAHVVAWGNAHVVAWGSAHVVSRENAHVVALENAHVVALENVHVEAWGSAHVEAWENAHVVARENAHVVAWGNAHVVAWGSAHVEAWENAHVVAWENAHVVARMTSSIKVHSEDTNITVKQYSTAICLAKCKIQQDKTANVIVCPPVDYDLKLFCDIYKNNLLGKSKIILYKSVNPDTLCDFYTGKIKYQGTVICPDWDSDINRECGGGLHLSPSPSLALNYNEGEILKCVANLKDIVVYPKNITKVRCRKVKVLGRYNDDPH